MSPTRFFLPEQLHPELMARCPAVGEDGKIVVWRGKRYYLWHHTDGKVFVHKLKRRV